MLSIGRTLANWRSKPRLLAWAQEYGRFGKLWSLTSKNLWINRLNLYQQPPNHTYSPKCSSLAHEQECLQKGRSIKVLTFQLRQETFATNLRVLARIFQVTLLRCKGMLDQLLFHPGQVTWVRCHNMKKVQTSEWRSRRWSPFPFTGRGRKAKSRWSHRPG